MQNIRNIAIIAHVDHGKTTLVDCLLNQSGLFRENQEVAERMMDSMDLEREKGITIRSKNAAINYKDCRINLVDTPGHADFGGEVERIMSMIDAVLLVVDAYEGPQAQTRFVLRKALESGAKPIVVVNKIDRPNANPEVALDQVFDLFLNLDASDDQLDFPVIYTSAKDGICKKALDAEPTDMLALLDLILEATPAPRIEKRPEFRMLIANLDYSEYLGRIALGKIQSGTVRIGDPLYRIQGSGKRTQGKVTSIITFAGMAKTATNEAGAGDIVGITGIEEVEIGETFTNDPEIDPLPFRPIDPPTITMSFAVNDGPFAGLDGKMVTARHIYDRLVKETLTNVSLRVSQTDAPNIFQVRARGEMQIAVLLEQMRREGYEALVSRPEAIYKQGPNGETLEPFEKLFVEIPNDCLGSIMENLANRKGDIRDMEQKGDMTRIEAIIPTRGLIGFETDLTNTTSGLGVMSHLFHEYAPEKGEIQSRKSGSLVSLETGKATAYSLDNLQQRAKLMIKPGDQVYPGMIVGQNSREEDLPCNPTKEKKLTNMRSSGDGKGILLDAPMIMTLERALEYIGPDEYVEATPHFIRLRKRILDENERKRAGKQKNVKALVEA